MRFRARLSTISRKWTAVHLAQREGDSAVEARIAAYELAYRMLSHAPEAVDLTHETERVVDQDLAPPDGFEPRFTGSNPAYEANSKKRQNPATVVCKLT